MKCQCPQCDCTQEAQYVDLNSSDMYCHDCIEMRHDES